MQVDILIKSTCTLTYKLLMFSVVSVKLRFQQVGRQNPSEALLIYSKKKNHYGNVFQTTLLLKGKESICFPLPKNTWGNKRGVLPSVLRQSTCMGDSSY